jgi:drug/metabolite transporter (DMT)-like permease
MLLYFYGLSVAPLAKVIAITFTAPLFATVMGVVILHEIIHARRIVALIIGFIGAVIILQPGVVEVDIGSVSIIVSAALWGTAMIIIKILGRTESSLTTTAYATIFLTPFCLIAAIPFWEWPSAEFWPWLFVIGLLGTLGQMSLAQAFKEADITVVLPLDFTKLIWAAILGYLVFGEVPDIWVWIGGTIIFASTTYITFRERRKDLN